MGSLLKETLKSLCRDGGWSYAVFWKIDCRNPMLLVWGEGHCEYYNFQNIKDGDIQLLKEEPFPNARVSLLVKLMEHHSHAIGKGISGDVALSGNHKWIHTQNLMGPAYSLFAGGSATVVENQMEIQHQILFGIKTLAAVPVLPYGVVQLGSTQTVVESMGFVNHMKGLFAKLGHIMGITSPSDNSTNYMSQTTSTPNLLGTPPVPSNESNFSTTYNYLVNRSASPMFSRQTGPKIVNDLLKQIILPNPNADCSVCEGHPLATSSIRGEVSEKVLDIHPNQSISYFFSGTEKDSHCSVVRSGISSNVKFSNDNVLSYIEERTTSEADLPILTNHIFDQLNSNTCEVSDFLEKHNNFPIEVTESSKNDAVSFSICNSSLSMPPPVRECLPGDRSNHSYISSTPELTHKSNETEWVKVHNNMAQTIDPVLDDSTVTFTTFRSCSHQHKWPTIVADKGSQPYETQNLISPKDPCNEFRIIRDSDESVSEEFILPSVRDDLFAAVGSNHIVHLTNINDNELGSCSSSYVKNLGPQSDLASSMSSISECVTSNHNASDQLLDAIVSLPKLRAKQKKDDVISCQTTITNIYVPSKSSSQIQGEMAADSLQQGSGLTFFMPIFGVNNDVDCSQEIALKSPASFWVEDGQNLKLESNILTAHSKLGGENGKPNRKRPRPGESSRPRPKDRQMIQDRMKELREIVPNGAKCSIDALLERTIKHMLFLQSITKHADKLKQTEECKINSETGSFQLKDNFEGGATWACEVGSPSTVCPIIVEDLNAPRQMLVKILCEERGFFLEIADVIRGIGLTILKGVMEARNDKVWARFVVEANRDISRMDTLLSLVRLLQDTIKMNSASRDTDETNIGHSADNFLR